MFDKTTIALPDIINQHTTIHEHRAPTDESVKLLREMEEAAKKAIVDSVRVQDTHFECVVLTQTDMINCEEQFVAIFSLNGKKMKTPLRISMFDHDENGKKLGPKEKYRRLVLSVAQDIADEILFSAFSKIGAE